MNIKFAKFFTLMTVLPGTAFAGKIIPQSEEERKEYIRTAEVWFPTDVASKNIFLGQDNKFKWGQTVKCSFMEPDLEDPPGGRSPKFYCLDAEGDDHKVKYGIDNGEVYAEAAASRLFWALGFGADRYYPVRVECEDCPKEPWTYIQDTLSLGVPRL